MTPSDALDASCTVSIAAMPKPFRGHIAVIQHNAIESWKRLSIAREVLLLGDEDGTADAAETAGVRHYPDVRQDSFGTPLVNDIFRVAEAHAKSDWLCYVNADIILMPEFAHAVRLAISALGDCLIISRRWNLEVPYRLAFEPGWEQELRKVAGNFAELFNVYGIDVFVFPKGFFTAMPPFAVGRAAWDNWIVAEAKRVGRPVVDVTAPYTVIHQNHSYSGFTSIEDIRRSQQGLRNFWLAGDSHFYLGRVDDATHQLKDGRVVPSQTRSVSVVVRNGATLSTLRYCLRALSNQTYPRTFLEIILVDSTDDNSIAAVALEFPYVRVTREMKGGPSASRNKGAAIASGELIAFLDADCIPAVNWVENAVAAAQKTRFASIVACNIMPQITRSGPAGVQWYQAVTRCKTEAKPEKGRPRITAAFVVPAAVWREIGPFDEESFETALENEWDWFSRATYRGIALTSARDAVVRLTFRASWRELRTETRRTARLAQIRSTKKPFRSLARSYTVRLLHELGTVLRDRRVPRSAALSSALAAAYVWFWTLAETRSALEDGARDKPRRKFSRAPGAISSAGPSAALRRLARMRR